MKDATLQVYSDSASPWERALYSFLVEKHHRSGSMRTVDGYAGMLRHFFGLVGKTPERVTSAEVFAWAKGPGLVGR